MASEKNPYGQEIGPPLPGWTRRPFPPHTPLTGQYCRLEKLDADRHAADLSTAYAEAPDDREWTYLPLVPIADLAQYVSFAQKAALQTDPLHHAIIDSATEKAIGTAALMRIDPDNGVIEVGHIAYSPRLQKTKAGTEAMYLLMRRAFDELGYRRYEWKCDSLNLPSRRAAERYGFQYEGTFRHAIVYKGRSRDTAWFSIIDREWPTIRTAFEQWLSPENFDQSGRQRRSLAAIRSSVTGAV
jgi:RimJ/RimL family protein N-acetyltransferase